MIRLQLRSRPRRALLVLALPLAFFPPAAAPSPTVDDVTAAIAAGDDARARELLDTLRSRGQGHTYSVRFLRGVLHLRAGEGEQAARVFDEIEASEGPAPALASGRAMSAWAAGRHAEARVRFENATRRWPDDPGVWAGLADVYRALAAYAYQRVRSLQRGEERSSSLVPLVPGPPQAPGTASSALSAAPAAVAESAASAESASLPESAASSSIAAAASSSPSSSPPSSGLPLVLSPPASSPPMPSPADGPDGPGPDGVDGPDGVASAPTPSPAAAAAGASTELPASAECFLAGPWSDAPPAAVPEWIEAHGARVLAIKVPSPRYRVYLGPFKDRRRALRTAASLKKNEDLRDVAWISSGPLRNAISFGVYRKRKSVDRRLRELRALDLKPAVQTIWTNARLLGATHDLQALRVSWIRAFPSLSLISEPCPPSPWNPPRW